VVSDSPIVTLILRDRRPYFAWAKPEAAVRDPFTGGAFESMNPGKSRRSARRRNENTGKSGVSRLPGRRC